MDLLLAEQVLLLGLDDTTGTDAGRWASEAGLSAALLLDLGVRDLLRVEADKTLTAVDGEPPGHELLRRAHTAVLGSVEQRTAQAWLARLQRELRPLPTELARGLVTRGILVERRTRVLGLFPQTQFPTADPQPERQLRQRLTELLLDDHPPNEREALLVGLLEPLGLVDRLVPTADRRRARARAKQIGQQGVAGESVREAVATLLAVSVGAVLLPTAIFDGSS